MTEEEERLPEVFVYCSKSAGFQCKGVVVPWKLLSEEQQADIIRLQSFANRNGLIKQEHTELEEGCFVCTPKFNAVKSVLRDWDWIVDGGYMVSEEHADKKWFQQAMFIYEQELPERIDGPIDFFELVKAAVTSGS